MTPEEVLLKAAELVERPNGWCRYNYTELQDDGMVAYCTLGAIHTAAGYRFGLWSTDEAQEKFHARAASLAATRLSHALGRGIIADWNDREATCGEDVGAWLRKAAEA